MSVRLDRKADLLLLQHGFDKNGKIVRRKNKCRKRVKNNLKFKKQKSFEKKIISKNTKLIEHRKNSDLSEGEFEIAEYLSKEGVRFVREYWMTGLLNPKTKKPLFFDFYVPSFNLVIEYDGIFHFKNEDSVKLKQQKEKDEIKNKFCQRKKIFMLRIPFWKRKRIEYLICERIDEICNYAKKGTTTRNNKPVL